VKLSDDEIEEAFTRSATVVERYFTRYTVRQTIPRPRSNEHYFHGRFYGLRNFCCKTAQFCATRRESEMAETPSVSDAAQNSETMCNSLGVNKKSVALSS